MEQRDIPIPDYMCHWFRDDPGRIDAAKAIGYEHVLDVFGRLVKREVDGKVAYRMKLSSQAFHGTA